MGLITLSKSQFLLTSVTLFLGIGALITYVSSPALYALYAQASWGKPYQGKLGFTTGWFRDSGGQPTCWGIIEVAKGGAFEAAGLRRGDVPRRFKNAGSADFFTLYHRGESGAISGFYSFLERSRGKGPVEFTVCSGCDDWERDNERRITIEVP